MLALAVFGAAHFLFLWEGDILFSYAVAALMLMVVLYAKPKPLIIAIVAVAGLGFIPGLSNIFAVAAGLAVAGLIATLSSQWSDTSTSAVSVFRCSRSCCC